MRLKAIQPIENRPAGWMACGDTVKHESAGGFNYEQHSTTDSFLKGIEEKPTTKLQKSLQEETLNFYMDMVSEWSKEVALANTDKLKKHAEKKLEESKAELKSFVEREYIKFNYGFRA